MEMIKNGTSQVGWDIGAGVPVDMSQRRVTSVVGSGIRWRSSEVEAAVVALSSSRCATARVWKSQAGWDVCSRASTSMRERVSAAALLCPGKCRISEVN